MVGLVAVEDSTMVDVGHPGARSLHLHPLLRQTSHAGHLLVVDPAPHLGALPSQHTPILHHHATQPKDFRGCESQTSYLALVSAYTEHRSSEQALGCYQTVLVWVLKVQKRLLRRMRKSHHFHAVHLMMGHCEVHTLHEYRPDDPFLDTSQIAR